MKKVFASCVLLITIASFCFSQNINTPENFPNPNFRKIVEQTIHQNNNMRHTEVIKLNENGHYYQAFYYSISYSEAKQVSSSLYNRNGYLVTISSQEELNFLINNYISSSTDTFLIGAERTYNLWEWMNGEIWNDHFWCNDYPLNNQIDYLTISNCGIKNESTYSGFIIEWSSNPVEIPEINFNVASAEEIVKSDLYKIGQAIEQLYQDKGVRLVDFFDQETPEGKLRLRDELNNVGNPSDRIRTAKDVLKPLVYFGYMNSIPDDPFQLKNTDPRIDTYLYLQNDFSFDNIPVRFRYPMREGHWSLLSPGLNGVFGGREEIRNKNNVEVTCIDVLSVEPFLSITKERVLNELQTIGNAINKFIEDKELLLVDHWDDDTQIGMRRLETNFQNIGNVGENNRRSRHLLEPLVEFGYLDLLPLDPYAREVQNLSSQTDVYFYMDNDPGIPGLDYFRNEDCCALRMYEILNENELQQGEASSLFSMGRG